MNLDHKTLALQQFLDNSPSLYHAVSQLETLLLEKGYTRLAENAPWELCAGGSYFLIRGGSALVAFRIPQRGPTGFLLSASHTDRPTFKVKEHGELVGQYTRLAVERYGGMLIAPWLDRPLSIAGRVLVDTGDGVESRLVNLDQDLLMIPNVAIHMNRKANDGYAWNPAVDVLPLVGSTQAQGKLQQALEQAAGGKLLGHDLYLYLRQKATVWGLEENLISSAGLDDLQCVWGCTQGFLNAAPCGAIPVLCLFDSEEVGSNSVQGAASMLLESTLSRIAAALSLNLSQLLANSFMVSADNAHAIHPNHPEYADPTNAPMLNGGIVLKFNAAQRYTTDAMSAALFRKLCSSVNVPVQSFYNRADLTGGSTLGHISLNHVSVPTADIGLPQLAMHSCYETAGLQDSLYLEKAMAAYYSATLIQTTNGYTLA